MVRWGALSRLPHRCVIALLGLCVAACDPPTPSVVFVDLLTDLAPGTEATHFRLELTHERGEAPSVRTVPVCFQAEGCDYLTGVRVADFADLERGRYTLVGEAYRGETRVLRHPLVFRLDEPRVATMVLTRSCTEITCAPGEACTAGRCEPEECSPETPESCLSLAQCESAADCPTPSECALPACVLGACLAAPSVDVCAQDERCAPVEGCVPAPVGPNCVDDLDADVVALYGFDDVGGATLTDEVGAHPGTIAMPSEARWILGPEGCGPALSTSSTAARIELPDDPAWDLTEGSVDFHVWHDGRQSHRAVFSRDASDQERSGHFTVALSNTGVLIVRTQTTTFNETRCYGPALAPGEWHHVGINFGGAVEVWIDGAVSAQRSDHGGGHANFRCGEGEVSWALAGEDGENDNPWLLLADRHLVEEEEPADGILPFEGGGIDRLRISRVRRDFSRP